MFFALSVLAEKSFASSGLHFPSIISINRIFCVLKVKADCRVSGVKEKLAPMMYVCPASPIYEKSYVIPYCRYSPLNVGELQPAGWLHNQLELQADGLSGYLALFWPDIANSTWIGGQTTDPGEILQDVISDTY